MAIVGLHHIQLAMPRGEEPAARRFYGSLLGLEVVAKPENLAKRGGVWFESKCRTVQVHLGVEAGFRPAKKAHPAFVVEDLEALVKRLEDRGAEVTRDEPLPGFDRVYVEDPFGNRIELLEPEPA